jgi:hypothetical protein
MAWLFEARKRHGLSIYKGVFNPENGVLRLENTCFWRDNL